MSKRASKKKGGNDDPIMYEVSDGSGNKPLPTSLQRAKGKKPGGGGGSKASAKTDKDEYGDASSSDDDDDDEDGDGSSPRRGRRKKGYFENIKWGNVMILLMLTMGGLAPVLIFLADNLGPAVGKFMPAMNLAPAMVSLGLMSTPQKRLIEFYNKHNQTDKLEEEQMNAIIMKYAGDYDTMIKKLERKYQDYGYFIGWEKEGGIVDVQEKTYQYVMDKGGYVYQRYVPFPIRNGVTKIGRNLNYFYKKAYKVLDKWTATPAKGGKKKASSKGKSRRARNSQSRDD